MSWAFGKKINLYKRYGMGDQVGIIEVDAPDTRENNKALEPCVERLWVKAENGIKQGEVCFFERTTKLGEEPQFKTTTVKWRVIQ
jgi:hypothetical protein